MVFGDGLFFFFNCLKLETIELRALARFMERTEPVIWGGTAAIHQPFFQSGPSGPFVPLANCKGPLGNRWSAPIGDSAVTQYRLLKHQYRWHVSWKKG